MKSTYGLRISQDSYVGVSIFRCDLTTVLLGVAELARRCGYELQVRSHRYDGFGRRVEHGAFYEFTVWPNGRANHYRAPLAGLQWVHKDGTPMSVEQITNWGEERFHRDHMDAEAVLAAAGVGGGS